MPKSPAKKSTSERAGRPADDGPGDGNGRDGRDGSDDGTTRSRRGRSWLPALALVIAVLGATVYVLQPSSDDGAQVANAGVGVDLREVGNRTVSLGRGVNPLALLQDDDALWVKSGTAATSTKLSKIDLASGEELVSVPFPESDTLSTMTAGAGSLWVTTSSAENMGGTVVRIDPETGREITTIPLPAWPGRAVFSSGSLWVATVAQPAAVEIGATPGAMSSAADALQRIDPDTNEVVASIELDGRPLDVRADDGLVLVSIAGTEEPAVVAIDPATGEQVASVPVPEGAEADADADPDAAGPWMLFVTDPYAVRVDIDAEAVAAVTGPSEGIDMLVPNGDQVWELRSEVLTIVDGNGDDLVTVTIDGTPLAAVDAGRDAAWIAYRPSGGDEVLVTRVTTADLTDL